MIDEHTYRHFATNIYFGRIENPSTNSVSIVTVIYLKERILCERIYLKKCYGVYFYFYSKSVFAFLNVTHPCYREKNLSPKNS